MHKTFRTLIASAFLAIASCAHAQSNNNAVAAATNASGASIMEQLQQASRDGYNQLTHIDLKHGLTVEPFALYHKGDFGAGLAVSTANTNGLNIGFAVAAVDEKDAATGKKSWNFYDASLSIGLRGTVRVPILDWPLDGYVETGPAVNLANPNTVYEQTIGGVRKTWLLDSKSSITLGGGIGHLSRWDGPFYIGHIAYTRSFQGAVIIVALAVAFIVGFVFAAWLLLLVQ